MNVTRDAGHYAVDSVIMLDVAPRTAFRAATDYERLPEFNPSIERSERVGDDRLHSDVRLCVAFFCRTIEQMMTYRERAPTRIDMQVVPDTGDLEAGNVAWQFEAAETGTRMVFRAEIEPAFWVPPVIGPYLIARELRAQARTTAEAIERLGADYEAADGNE